MYVHISALETTFGLAWLYLAQPSLLMEPWTRRLGLDLNITRCLHLFNRKKATYNSHSLLQRFPVSCPLILIFTLIPLPLSLSLVVVQCILSSQPLIRQIGCASNYSNEKQGQGYREQFSQGKNESGEQRKRTSERQRTRDLC